MNLFRKKEISHCISLTKKKGSNLKRTLTTFDIIAMAVGGSVGAGIFSITANTAANYSGPAVDISFLITTVLCALICLCYLEFATAIPVAGGAYSYSYIALGEFIAWIIGWNLILEMLFTSALVAKAWSTYLRDMFRMLNINIVDTFHFTKNAKHSFFDINIDIGSILIILLICVFILQGTKMSSKVINIITIIKVTIIIFLIIVGLFYISKQNWSPFIPHSQPISDHISNGTESSLWSMILHQKPSRYGINGIFTGAAIVFFAFLGFDIVASSAEDVKNPKKSLPIGMLGGISILGFLYIAVSTIITGMVPFIELKKYAKAHNTIPTLTTAFEIHNVTWAGIIISFGAVIGLLAVLILFAFGTTRIIFAISRDGLLPKTLSKTTGKNNVPKNSIVFIIISIIVASSFFDLDQLTGLVNICVLSTFTIISISIPIIRKNKKFNSVVKVPFSPVLPTFTGICCMWLILNLPVFTWIRFAIWLIIGTIIYFAYSKNHSLLNKNTNKKPK